MQQDEQKPQPGEAPPSSPPEATSATEAPPGAEAAAGAETLIGLQQRLRQAEALAAERQDALLRALAETENVRKRAQADAASAQKYAVEGFAGELLAVKDSLEAALAAENTTVEQIRSGVELTLKQLAAVFDKFKLCELNPAGEKFDPHRHQAICAVESDHEPNTVINVMQKGYMLHDRVIRPALVTVSRAKDG